MKMPNRKEYIKIWNEEAEKAGLKSMKINGEAEAGEAPA
jgi:hypothetical protein